MCKTISEIMLKMISISNGNQHDINHFMKVYAYAKTIAECENISQDDRVAVEAAAIIHDIACPLCREKYGNTNGKKQEIEGVVLAKDFLMDTGLPEEIRNRVIFLVGHHHTPKDVDGIDYQILLEADYLVNADEMNLSAENIRNAMQKLFRTQTGISILRSIYEASAI